MNREEKRNLKRKGLSDKAIKDMEMLSAPCTIGEAVQLSQSVVKDALKDYSENYASRLGSVTIVQTLHLEVIKNLLIEKGIITAEEYEERLKTASEEYDRRKQEMQKELDEKEASVVTEGVVNES